MSNISLKLVRKLEASAPPEKDRLLADDEISGFYLKITKTGHISYVFQYRTGGRGTPTKRFKIGDHPAMTPAKAREAALQLRAKVQNGDDPQKKKLLGKLSEANAKGLTFEALFIEYEKLQLSQNRSGREVGQLFRREFTPALGKFPLREITRANLSKIINAINGRGTGYAANRALRLIKTFFKWAAANGYIDADPAANMAKPFKGEKPRERVLNHEEIRKIWNACEQINPAFGNAIRFLLLTGQRRDELGHMRWADMNEPQTTLTLTEQDTKNKRTHEVPLSEWARSVINAQPKSCDYVFTTNLKTPISGWSKTKTNLDKVCGVANWRIHDIRRTVATGMGDCGIETSHIAVALNHKYRGVTGIYNRSNHHMIKQRAFAAWEKHLKAILEKKTGEITSMPKKQNTQAA